MTALLQRLAARPEIAFVLFFGSRARGSEYASSDLDLAIGLFPGIRLATQDLGALVADLEEACHQTVDLVLADEAPPTLAYRIFRGGRVLLDREPALLVRQKAKAFLEYLGFQPGEALLARRADRSQPGSIARSSSPGWPPSGMP